MEEEVRSLKEEVKVLEAKVKVLEKEERKRKTKSLIKLLIKIIVFIIIAIGLYRAYLYIDKTFITPYKETMEKIEGIYNTTKESNILNWFNKQ